MRTVGRFLVFLVLAIPARAAGGANGSGVDAWRSEAAKQIPYVLGFSDAGFFPGRDSQKAREFLEAMGYASERQYNDDVISRVESLSAKMARVGFYYMGLGRFMAIQDYLIGRMAAEGFELYATINPVPSMEGRELDAAFEGALVDFIKSHPEVSGWQIGNEPDLTWTDYTLYPAFFVRAQPVIRAACPSCKILLAGISNQYDTSAESFQRYDRYLGQIASARLSGRPFDIFDFHYYKEKPNADEIRRAVKDYRGLLSKHGLADGVSFWCTETGTYTGDPPGPLFGLRTERDQARDLARMVASMAAEGIERIFYWTVIESWGNPGIPGFFDQMGLIYNGLGEEPALGIRAGTKKKAYGTYGLLAQALQGTTAATRLGSGVYRFDRGRGAAFVVWDEAGTGSVVLEGLPASSVRVQELVPDDQGGVPTRDLRVVAGAVTLSVGDSPKLVTLDPASPRPNWRSPFGVFAAYATEFGEFCRRMGFSQEQYWDWADAHMRGLDAAWTRSNLQLIWQVVEPVVGQGYQWDAMPFRGESVFTRAARNGVNYVAVFAAGGDAGTGRPPLRDALSDPDAYARFVTAAVRRYSPLPIRYWQIGNEFPLEWRGRPIEEYLAWARLTSQAIKAADPEARVVLIAATDGLTVPPWLERLIAELAPSRVIDVVDLHHWGPAGAWRMPAVPRVRELLDRAGRADAEIFSMEHGTWAGSPSREPPQGQLDQAGSLVRRFVFNLANGLDKLFWNNLVEWVNFDGDPGSVFNSMGLIGDGIGSGEKPEEFNRPRLSYWAYQRLSRLLGDDLRHGARVATADSSLYLYAYPATPGGTLRWVAWSESGDTNVEITRERFTGEALNLVAGEGAAATTVVAADGRVLLRVGLDPAILRGRADPPVIRAVVNAASFQSLIAPGALATVFGFNLDEAEVQVDGRVAPVLYAGAAQVNFYIPPELPPGSVSLVVSSGGARSSPFQLTLSATAPALFAVLNEDGSLNSSDRPASRGAILQVFGTGMGAMNPAGQTVLPVQVEIGGSAAEVQYSGVSPGTPGLHQVNARVPATLPAGSQMLTVAVGGRRSPPFAVFLQ